jgi:hypothetical protein
MLDLPYTMRCDEEAIKAIEAGDDSLMANIFFDWDDATAAVEEGLKGLWDGIGDAAKTVKAGKCGKWCVGWNRVCC